MSKLRKLYSFILKVLLCLIIFYLGVISGRKSIYDDSSINSMKFDEVMNIMKSNWFFGENTDEFENELMDRALYGMSEIYEKDPFTTYMSKEEIDEFVNSINLDFVGIGVEFIRVDDFDVVVKVFKDSPADKAGVIEGDIFNKVNNQSLKGLSTDEIGDLVRGEENSVVTIEFLRQNKPITLEITRERVNASAYGEMVDNKVGYLQIYQFGNSTADEVYKYITDMKSKGMERLIIDLRNNGGGYLDALEGILSYLLDNDTLIMKQEYKDGTIDEIYTNGDEKIEIDKIVLLVNENTASASEVMTLGLKENMDNLVIVGKKTYGKGTVQISEEFVDGSAIKYTTSKWLSPNGVWVNQKGISPDIEVDLPYAVVQTYPEMDDDEVYSYDEVGLVVSTIQNALSYLGYDIDRFDGYFSKVSEISLTKFQNEHGLEANGKLDKKTYETVYSLLSREYALNKAKDTQYQKALEIINE